MHPPRPLRGYGLVIAAAAAGFISVLALFSAFTDPPTASSFTPQFVTPSPSSAPTPEVRQVQLADATEAPKLEKRKALKDDDDDDGGNDDDDRRGRRGGRGDD